MKVLVNESSLEDIANAIRSKNGDTAKYKPSEMSSAISNITTTISPNYNVKFTGSNNETISLGWLRTDNMTSMDAMFSGCNSLTSLDLSNFSTSNVTDMSSMFYNCSSLTSLDLSNLNTSNVTGMSSMFYNCSSLTSLDLSNFDTSKVTDMRYMFASCTALKTLDIRNFTFTQSTNGSNMFGNAGTIFGVAYYKLIPADCKIIVKDDAARNWIKSAKYDVGSGTDYKTYGDYLTNIKTVAEL